MLYRMIKLRHSSLVILVAGIFLIGLSYFFGFLNFDPTGELNFRQTRLFQLQILFQTISVFAFFIHYELNLRSEPRPWITGGLASLLVPYSMLNIFYLITDNYSADPIFQQYETFSLALLQIGVIFLFSWLFHSSYKIALSLENYEPRVARLSHLQFIGISILFLGVILQLVEAFSPLNVWHTPLNVLAVLLIGVPYAVDPKVMLFAPVNIRMFGIVDSYGRTLYHKALDVEFKDPAEAATSELFGGLTLAFTNLGAEVAKSKTSVDSMKFADRSIILEFNYPYYMVVIADSSSFFLEREMAEYLSELKSLYPAPPEDGSIIPEEVFHKLNNTFFPVFLRK